MSAHNRALVEAFYKKLYSEAYVEVMAHTLSDHYVEHQYTADFTKTGLGRYVKNRLTQNPHHRIIVHKVLSEKDFVFLLVEEKLENNVDVARAELFRVVGDKITEHWSAHVIDEKQRKNGNGTFDGPQVNRDVNYARQHVARFLELDYRGFGQQEIECFYESRTREYKQHSPKGGDGLEGLVTILRKMKESGQKMIMQPKRAMVDGDFIVCHRLYDSFPKHPLVNRINTFDLFRINADGKAVEHWDVMEDVPTDDMLAKIF
jgi:predicted SnoaL-like aldol condensation-catalyzing enzyme